MERRHTIWPGSRRELDAGLKRIATETLSSTPPLKRSASIRTENGNIPRHPVTRFSGGPLRSLSLLSGTVRRVSASPWENDFKQMMVLDEGPPTTIAYDAQYPEKIVAVRELKDVKTDRIAMLKPVPSEYIVSFRSVYLWEGTAYLVCEPMSVALCNITATRCGPLCLEDVAQVCLCVLQGTSWMHHSLGQPHGQINNTTVMLAGNGAVKIDCVGDAMLTPVVNATMATDIASVGDLVRTMIHPTTDLESSWEDERYNPLVAKFILETISNTCEAVLQHPFLKLSRGSRWLARFVCVAVAVQTRAVKDIVPFTSN